MVTDSNPATTAPFFGPHALYEPNSPEFNRQTAVCDSLPHACTVARMDNNWRKAADELIRYLNNRGYDVVKMADDGE